MAQEVRQGIGTGGMMEAPLAQLKDVDFSTGFHRTNWGSYEQRQLRNGMVCHLVHFSGSSNLDLQLVVKSGSRSDDPASPGIAHFVEHLKFTGRDERNELEECARKSINENAYTSSHITCFKVSGPSRSAEAIFARLHRHVTNDQFDPDFLEREKKVVAVELMERLQRPSDYFVERRALPDVRRAMESQADILGTPQSIAEFSVEKAEEFVRKKYRPDNMELLAVGNLSGRHFDVETAIATTFGSMPRRWLPMGNETTVKMPECPRGIDTKFIEVPGVHLRIVAPFEIESLQQELAAQVLTCAISSGPASLLHHNLRFVEGLQYSMCTSMHFHSEKIGCEKFGMIVAGPAEANRSLEIVDGLLARVAEHGLPEDLFRQAQEKVRAAIPVFELGVADLIATMIGRRGKIILPDKLADKLESIRASDIKVVAQKWRNFHVAAGGDVRPGEICLPDPRRADGQPSWREVPRGREISGGSLGLSVAKRLD